MGSSVGDIIMSVIMIGVLAAILYWHIAMASSVWKTSIFSSALIKLMGLSLLTTIVWSIIGLLAIIFVAMSSEAQAWASTYFVTLGLPLDNACDVLAHFYKSIEPTSCDVPLVFIVPVFLFVLGLIPLIWIKPGRRWKTLE